jgi:arylsulfatase A-like enzyme
MPAMVRWPGRIKPGTITGELAATYDIFTTMIVLAGGKVPTDRVIDGVDLSPILFEKGGKSKHDCLMQVGMLTRHI